MMKQSPPEQEQLERDIERLEIELRRADREGDEERARRAAEALRNANGQLRNMRESRPVLPSQQDSIFNESRYAPGLQSTTGAGRAGEIIEDIVLSGATGLERGVTAAPQIVPAAGNLAAEGYNRVANLFREEERQRQYVPPFVTREEWLNAAQNAGLISEFSRQYRPQGASGEIAAFAGEGAGEGLGAGSLISLGRRGLGVARGTFRRGDLARSGSDILREAGAGSIAGGAVGGAAQLTDDPNMLLAAGILGGVTGGRTMFASTRADEIVRRGAIDIPQSTFDGARTLSEAAAELGIELNATQAIAMANALEGGAESRDLVALAEEYLNRSRLGRQRMGESQRNVQEGGQIDQALADMLEEVRDGLPARDIELAGNQAVSLAQEIIRDARELRTATLEPLRQRLRADAAPPNFSNALDRALEASVADLPPQSSAYTQVQRIRSKLRNADGSLTNSVDALDEAFQEYYDIVNATNLAGGSFSQTALARRINGVMSRFDNQLDEISEARRDYRRQYAEYSRREVNPIESALLSIADDAARSDAEGVVRTLMGYSPNQRPESPGRIRRGFLLIAERDPALAGDLLAAHIDRVFAENMTQGPDARRSITTAADFRRALFGQTQTKQSIQLMMDVLDEQRGLPKGTTFQAFTNFINATGAAGQVNPRIRGADLAEDIGRARGVSGAAQSTLQNLIIALPRGAARIWGDAVAGNNYHRIAKAFTDGDPNTIRHMADMDARDPELLSLAAILIGERVAPNQEEE